MKISLLFNPPGDGAGPDDRDTLDQVQAIREALEQLGHRSGEFPVPEDFSLFRRQLRAHRDELFFNLTDPRAGEGRLIALYPLALEQEGCSYTGCGADALYLTSNKLLAKRIMEMGGIPTPRRILRPGPVGAAASREPFIPGRYLIKSVWEHGSAGMSADSVFSAETREAAEKRLAGEPEGVFAEAFLPVREINVALLAGESGDWTLLPPSEIRYTDPENPAPFLDYRSKWEDDSSSFRHSLRSMDFSEGDQPLLRKLERITLACASLFELNGYARVDFRLDGPGNPMVMEVNANPCLTPGGGFAAAAEKAGIDFPEMIRRIISVPIGLR